MKIMSAIEAQCLLNEHRSADIRQYIKTHEDGGEEVIIPLGAGRPVQMVIADSDRRITGLRLSNGKSARNGEYVYLIRAANGLVKIGYTQDVARRFYSLTNTSPIALELIGCIETAIAETIEAELHQQYAHVREHGEWFRLSDNDVQEILGGALWQDPPS